MSKKANFFTSPHALADIDAAAPVLVALSGGADSACLLHLLCDYAKSAGCRIFAAHVNHNIRTEDYGNEARRDEDFCRALCARLNVSLFVLDVNVPALAKKSGRSLETEARLQRYSFFARVMRENGIKILATAHNADDNLETQIFNLCRGCGAEGLCGIPRSRSFIEAEGLIVRPILDATKAQVLDYCKSRGIDYVTDSTNLEDDCTRNRIRHNVIPELVSLFGTPQRASLRLSESLRRDCDFIGAAAEQLIDESGDSIPISALCSTDEAISSRVISIAYKKTCQGSLEGVHIESVLDIVKSQKDGAAVSLPGKIRAAIKSGHLVFEPDERAEESTQGKSYDIELTLGFTEICGTPFIVSLELAGQECRAPEDYELIDHVELYLDGLDRVRARNRQAGDVILNGGMHKKIKKLMCDKKTDVSCRALLPIIYRDQDIIFVPLCAISDTVKKQSGKTRLKISIFQKRR